MVKESQEYSIRKLFPPSTYLKDCIEVKTAHQFYYTVDELSNSWGGNQAGSCLTLGKRGKNKSMYLLDQGMFKAGCQLVRHSLLLKSTTI